MRRAFSLVEVLVCTGILAVLAVLAVPAASRIYESSSLAVSAANIRQLAAGAAGYLADNQYTYWKYVDLKPEEPGSLWWFGFEPSASAGLPEGQRSLDVSKGPLGGYLPAASRPDPSFALGGRAFKPKYQNGYLGVGYNVLLGGGWIGTGPLVKYWDLADPSRVVVFATSAQVNTFQAPASARNPMLEEFYGLDKQYATVHFRHHGQAMVAFANGSAGLLPMDESTRDLRMPRANVGRFAPKGDATYLK